MTAILVTKLCPAALVPWIGLVLVLAASRSLLAVVCWQHRTDHLAPETARKVLHVGMGTILLACPWLFDRAWPVFALAAVFLGLLFARLLIQPLQRQVAGVIYGVDRRSRGEYYFPVSVAILFFLARADAMLYCVPLSLLVFADAAAAIVGTRYGSTRFASPAGQKSLEGSVAFAVTAFLIAHVVLLLTHRVSPGISLLVALNLALASTAFEALSWDGLDNLTVPIGAFALLSGMLNLTGPEMLACLGVVGGSLGVTVLVLRIATGKATPHPMFGRVPPELRLRTVDL